LARLLTYQLGGNNMKQDFTKKFMQDNCGCYSKEQLMNCSFMKSEIITLQSILDSEISIKDKYWFVCKKLATKEQNQQIAIGVAEIVLVIFENKYPDDKRPREAIQAAKDYLSGVIGIDKLRKKRAAAAAANAAAAAANAAAAAAANAAYAAAANAAYAAAAYAAAAAAYAANALKESLLIFLKEFCIKELA
jgi:hypothetical protein